MIATMLNYHSLYDSILPWQPKMHSQPSETLKTLRCYEFLQLFIIIPILRGYFSQMNIPIL